MDLEQRARQLARCISLGRRFLSEKEKRDHEITRTTRKVARVRDISCYFVDRMLAAKLKKVEKDAILLSG